MTIFKYSYRTTLNMANNSGLIYLLLHTKLGMSKTSKVLILKMILTFLILIPIAIAYYKCNEVPVREYNVEIKTANNFCQYGTIGVHIGENHGRSGSELNGGLLGVYVKGAILLNERYSNGIYDNGDVKNTIWDSTMVDLCKDVAKQVKQVSLPLDSIRDIATIRLTASTHNYLVPAQLVHAPNVLESQMKLFHVNSLPSYKEITSKFEGIRYDSVFFYTRGCKFTGEEHTSEYTMAIPMKANIVPVDFYYATTDEKGSLCESNDLFSYLLGEDVAKSHLRINVNIPYTVKINTLSFTTKAPSEFLENLAPSPDSIAINGIYYNDSTKLDWIRLSGLELHVRYPDLEDVQDAKIFLITTILAILLAIFFKLMYDLFHPIISRMCSNKRLLFNTLFVITCITIILFTYLLYKASCGEPIIINI